MRRTGFFAVFLVLFPAPVFAQQADPASCLAMDTMAAALNQGGTENVQKIRGIFTEVGLAFGGPRTSDKCLQAINAMAKLEDDPAPACEEVAALTTDIMDILETVGALESSTLQGILVTSGMQVAGLNPDGVDNEITCRRAAGPLGDYLATLQLETSSTGDAYRRTDVERVSTEDIWALTGGDAMTLWSNNGSKMAWEVGPGTARKVWYWEPRTSLTGFGIERGTLLFEGNRQGRSMSGEARMFTRNCGVYIYPVSGPISDDDRRVTLNGLRPVVDSDCRVTRTAEDILVFDYVDEAPAGETFQQVGADEGYDTPGFGVWATRFRVGGVTTVLNLRSDPSGEAAIITELPADATDILAIGSGCLPEIDQITFHDAPVDEKNRMISQSWCNVTWNDYEGWVFGEFLRAER